MIYLNGTPLNVTMFPDNTSQVWHIPEENFSQYNSIKWEFQNEGELMHLAQLKDLIDKNNLLARLTIKYLPYGRQDKDISNNATFALNTFSKLLNSLNFARVEIIDPHSLKATELIDNSYDEYPEDLVYITAHKTGATLFVYPDKGAHTKYMDIYDYPAIYGKKQRDQETGWITNYELIGDPKDHTVLIVDDICDGGMTFKILAKDLLDAGAKEVNLFVTHGLFSKGLKTLKESGINRIFTQDGEVSEVQDNIVYRKL